MRRLLVTVILGLACTEERPAAKSPTSAPPGAASVVVAPPAADAGAIAQLANPNGLDGHPDSAEWLHDGTLVVSSEKEVLTLDATGKIRHLATHGRQVKTELWGKGEAFILEGTHDLVLMDGSFRELWKGEGHFLTRPGDAAASGDQVVVYRSGKLIKLDLPKGKSKHVETLEIVGGGKTALVTWTAEEAPEPEAGIFDVATGRHLGTAFANATYTMRPIASNDGKVQYGIADTTIKVIDLETAAVVRTGKVACGKDSFVGNPMPSPSGDLLLVTCGMDGIGLDPKTFAVKRRYAKIIPGCDNGEILPAAFDKEKPGELVLEGCGGMARLEMSTGKYKCSDDVGLVGAPYDVVMPPIPRPGGPSTAPRPPVRRAPAGRENLPRCTPVDQSGMQPSFISGSATYKHGWDDKNRSVIEHAGGKIVLEEGASGLALSPDETKVAYMTKDRVIIRALPKGDIVREITAR